MSTTPASTVDGFLKALARVCAGRSGRPSPDARVRLTFDNHNSVNGIREYARKAGAGVTYIPVVPLCLAGGAARRLFRTPPTVCDSARFCC
ncbi:MAG TPA: hypothetical protein VF332_07625 [Vicinamibacterales bacterium]